MRVSLFNLGTLTSIKLFRLSLSLFFWDLSSFSSYCFFFFFFSFSFYFIFFFVLLYPHHVPLMGPGGLEEELDIFLELLRNQAKNFSEHAKLSTGNINGRLFEAGESVERYSARVCVYVIKSKS